MKNRFLKFNSAFFLTLFSLSSAHAANGSKAICTAVDLREEMGPIRNQGDMGWCYANAAADLLSFKLRNELKGQQVSAAYTALTYLRTLSFMPTTDGGYVSAAVLMAKENGLCTRALEDKVQSTGLTNLTLNERLDALQNFKKDWDLSLDGDDAATKRFMDRYREYIKTKSIVAQIPRETLISILNNSTRRTFISELTANICKDQLKFPVQDFDIVVDTKLMSNPIDFTIFDKKYHIGPIAWNPFSYDKDFIEPIDEQLSRKNVVAIDYFSKFLKSDFLKLPISKREGMHASVVVGRRWNDSTRSCEYLIRNSWGSGCGSYKVKQNCEGGNIWVPEKTLRHNLFAYIYLE